MVRKSKKRLWLKGALIGLFVFLFGLIFPWTHIGQSLEWVGLDWLFIFRGALPEPQEVVIVALDEPSFAEIGKQWPWPRSLFARLVKELSKDKARVVGFDILFIEPSEAPQDKEFASAMREASHIVLASDLSEIEDSRFHQVSFIDPLPLFHESAKGLGIISLQIDSDHFVRRVTLSFHGRPSFALEVVRARLGEKDWNPEQRHPSLYINYIGPRRSIQTVSFYQALNSRSYLPPDFFKDKVVLVGLTVGASPDPKQRSPDAYPIPFSRLAGGLMSGVEIHANIVHNLLHNAFVLPLKEKGRIFLCLFIGFVMPCLLLRFKPFHSFGISVLFGLVYFLFIHLLFAQRGLWFPLFSPLLQIFTSFGSVYLYQYFSKEREVKWVKKAFSHYVSPKIVEEILEHPEALKLGGEKVEGTVLFADLADFTSLSEDLSPDVLVTLLNEYFSEMTEIILRFDGTLDKYIGDAIMGFWGSPVIQEDHALRACSAAWVMQQRMALLREDWKKRGLTPLHTRIGLNSGSMIAGNVGSKTLFDFTVIGDTVNLASRLEEGNKIYGTSILISEYTFEQAEDWVIVREVGTIQVKGRRATVRVYELVGMKEEEILS
jgi:adenylate cyclase